MAVAVPNKEIKRQLEDIRDSGAVNMMDMQGVQKEAADQDYHALVLWIEDEIDERDWHRLVFEGVKTESEKAADTI